MMGKILQLSFIGSVILLHGYYILAQDKRAQYPAILNNSYFGVSIGYINYAFSQRQLEPGYTAESVHVPHTAVRLILFGHRFNKYLSAQISYMRPVDWIEYKNVNGSHSIHKVGMNIAGLTIRSGLPVSKKISFNAEAGLGIITRGGFLINDIVVLKDATYTSLLVGCEMKYALNKNWEFMISTAWSPAHAKVKQPATVFYAAGFNYTLHLLSHERVERNSNSGFIFPKQIVQAGYATNALGYRINNFVSKGTIPIFWGGEIQAKKGFSINYQRNIFHTRKVFSLDWGTGLSYWQSKKNKQKFFTLSVYPLFRFTALRWKPFDLYFNYSVAGPAFISKTIIDGKNTGEKFTFQDFMGMGIFTGTKRKVNAEIRIAHYSNGNLFPQNNGIMIPLTFTLGYSIE
jgi:hypothetical protein